MSEHIRNQHCCLNSYPLKDFFPQSAKLVAEYHNVHGAVPSSVLVFALHAEASRESSHRPGERVKDCHHSVPERELSQRGYISLTEGAAHGLEIRSAIEACDARPGERLDSEEVRRGRAKEV